MRRDPFPDDPRKYLRPPTQAFWCWQASGNELAWSDGHRLIAFRDELRGVLLRQADRGLPPLGAVLLVLAAVRESWDEAESEQGLLANIVRRFDDAAVHLELLSEIHEGLDRVRKLDGALRRSAAGKAELIDLIFENCHDRTSPATAVEVLRLLEGTLPEELLGPVPLPLVASWWHLGAVTLQRDLTLLKTGLLHVDEPRLRMRVRTGLEVGVRPAQVELSLAESVAALIKRLGDHDELGGVARIAQHLMAAVTLPRRISQLDELHLGGVSDITNRGPLDRLLLSELAHDDLTLSVRVAMNEALYLRRESPPRSPPRTRAMLLDCGVRSWGVPRVFATAVALALAATADKRDHIVTWRANGARLDAVDLTTAEGLTSHLEQLATTIHPGAALAQLARELAACESNSEAVLVTTADTLADPDFQRALSESPLENIYLASVNREGNFQLSLRSMHGQKLLRSAQLNLDDLLAAPRRGRTMPLIDEKSRRDLPAIFAVRPFPLLLPHPIDQQQTWPTSAGALALTGDQRLMAWFGGQAAFQLSDRLPRGAPLWHSRTVEDDVAYAVVGPQQSHRLSLLTIDLDQRQCEVNSLPLSPGVVRAVSDHNGALVVIFMDRVEVFGVGDHQCLGSLKLPSTVVWMRDRFFKETSTDRWLALAYDGVQASLEAVVSAQTGAHCPKLAGLFDRAGFDGPWGVTFRGDLYDTVADNFRNVTHDLAGTVGLLAANRRGDRIVIGRHSPTTSHDRNAQRLVDVDGLTSRRLSGVPQLLVNLDAVQPWVSYTTLRSRFQAIAYDNGLLLVSRKGMLLRPAWDAEHRLIRLCGVSGRQPASTVAFEPHDGPDGVGYRLARAMLDDLEVFTDSRGLLHVRRPGRNEPEVTLVLNENHLAGWCSRGGAWGLKFYTGAQAIRVPPESCRTLLAHIVQGYR